jgi:hypothetical protein
LDSLAFRPFSNLEWLRHEFSGPFREPVRDREPLCILHGQDDVIAAFVATIRVDRADKSFLVSLRCFHFHREFFFKYSKIALVIEARRCLSDSSRKGEMISAQKVTIQQTDDDSDERAQNREP